MDFCWPVAADGDEQAGDAGVGGGGGGVRTGRCDAGAIALVAVGGLSISARFCLSSAWISESPCDDGGLMRGGRGAAKRLRSA